MLDPRTSEGSKSGVNWIRRKEQSILAAMARRQQGLAHAGHILDQHMSFGQQGDDGQPDDFGLAQDDEPDVFDQSIREGKEFIEFIDRGFGDLGRIHAVRSTDGASASGPTLVLRDASTINH